MQYGESTGYGKAAAYGQTTDFRRVMGASTLTGDDVYNSEEEHLGKIDEIMLDVVTGRVSYAVLSMGGFLGMGDKLFAVPWQALHIDEPNHRFILDVPKSTLENAPGFDKDHWPDMSSEEFGNKIYGYYGYTWSK
jgi:sporulation protein YlmC with PRC-barrel domain